MSDIKRVPPTKTVVIDGIVYGAGHIIKEDTPKVDTEIEVKNEL